MIKILYFLFFVSNIAYAQVGDLQTINTVSFNEGRAFGNDYQKYTYNLFTEYGLSKKHSIGGSAALVNVNPAQGRGGYALNNAEIFHRYKLGAIGRNGLVIHNSVKLPGFYREDKNIAFMPRQYDYEFRLIGLHNFKERLISSVVHSSTPYFLRVELAYRNRWNNPFNEVRFAFWGGVDLGHGFSLLLQDNITWNIQKNPSLRNNTYQNFNLSKDANNIATCSVLFHYSKHTAFQLGYSRRIDGNNPFYDRQSFIFGLWNAVK